MPLSTAGDEIVAACGVRLTDPVILSGAIGRAALVSLLPGKRPRTSQAHTLDIQIIKDGSIDNPNRT